MVKFSNLADLGVKITQILDLGPSLGCFQENAGDFVLNEGYNWIL